MTVRDQGAAHPTSDIILENMQISTVDDATGWTTAQWQAQGRSGFREVGAAGNGTDGEPYTTCISMAGSKIKNVRFGAALFGNNSLFQNNDLGYFGDDGIDYGAHFLTIAHNYSMTTSIAATATTKTRCKARMDHAPRASCSTSSRTS